MNNKRREELNILKEELSIIKAKIRMNSYGFVISSVGLGSSTYYYINSDGKMMPIVIFSSLAFASTVRSIANIMEERNINKKIMEEEKKLTLCK